MAIGETAMRVVVPATVLRSYAPVGPPPAPARCTSLRPISRWGAWLPPFVIDRKSVV